MKLKKIQQRDKYTKIPLKIKFLLVKKILLDKEPIKEVTFFFHLGSERTKSQVYFG